MAIFYDGMTDNLTAAFLSSIEWRIAYNTLQGEAPDTPLFRSVIPGAQANSQGVFPSEGAFSIESAPLAGSQVTTISWYADEGRIRFHIVSVTAPK